MGFTIEEDFTIINNKKGGGTKKKKEGERKKGQKENDNCYSSKHVRNKEALMLKIQQKK